MTDRVDSTLSKGLKILETLAASPKPLGITEIAAQLSMNKSNVHRLVKTLCKMNYAAQDPDRTYRASLKLWRIGNDLMSHQRLASLCMAAMHDLLQATGESVHLSVIDGAQVMHVEKIDSDQTVRAYTERGETAPLHCVASGKVLLAYHYDHLRTTVFQGMEAFTPRTIVEPEALDEEMAQVRRLGYALNTGEHRADVAGLAAPVFASDVAVAAIGLSAPTQRLTRQRIKEMAPAVLAAGKAASEAVSASVA